MDKQVLINCFKLVFPLLTDDEILRCSTSSFPEWDSVSNIQLTCIIEEECGVDLPDDILESLTSFDLIFRYIRDKV